MLKAERTAILAAIGAVAVFWSVVLVATWNVPHGLFGWNLGSDGQSLIYVSPSGPAARAGLQVGDRLNWSTLPLVGRANLAIVESVLPSTRLHVTFSRGNRVRSTVVVPQPWPKALGVASHVLTLAGIFLVVIGIILVRLRPSRMTWGFLLSSLLWGYPTYIYWFWAQTGSSQFMLADGLFSLLTGAYAAGILIFMSRFPSDVARGPLVLLDRCAIPLGACVALLGLYIDAIVAYSASPPPAWALFANQSLVQILLFAIALAALFTAYALAASSDRQRIIPVLIAFALYVASTMGHNIYSAFYTNPTVHAMWYLLIAASMIALAAAVAHGVVRHRVFDASFAISRTVVYTILTSIIVGVFVLIDFVSAKLLDRFQVAIFLEAAAALTFGVWLNALHSRVDKFVDRVFFRKRHLAEARLKRVTKALNHAEDAQFVNEALILEAAEALDLSSAAVFRQSDSVFERVNSTGWDAAHASRLSQSDPLIIHMRAELDAFDVSLIRWRRRDVPAGFAQPLLAVPLCVRHELLGVALYSGHCGGEALDPDEVSHLKNLAHAAAAAYDHIEAVTLRRRIAEAQTEIAQLRHAEDVMREMLQAVRAEASRVEG